MTDLIYNKYLEAGNRVCTDTRNIIPGSLFFALKGANFNGNKYASEAIKKGAKAAVIDDENYESESTILVPDTLKALQKLAIKYRKERGFKVIGLTGTNGKTTTKELIKSVLETNFRCHATQGNLNNHIGVPLTILSASPEDEILVVEMGANHIGEIADLCEICKPDLGLITNIGKAHLEGFGGVEGVKKAKSELYTYLKNGKKPIFVNLDDKTLLSLLNNYEHIEGYGTVESGVFPTQVGFNEGVSALISLGGQELTIKTQLFGNYNITNILAAIKIGSFFNISPNKITSALNNYQPTNNRSQFLTTSFNSVVMDSYNANPSSMKAALDSFLKIDHQHKVLILGAMKELGNESDYEHKKIAGFALESESEFVFFVGEEYAPPLSGKENNRHFKNTKNLKEYLIKNPLKDKLILIKGSRSNKLEEIIKFV